MGFRFIKLNKAKCNHCGDIVISDLDSASTEYSCTCGKLSISGGYTSLLRTGQQGTDFTEMSILDFGECPAVKDDIQEPPPQQGEILNQINNKRK